MRRPVAILSLCAALAGCGLIPPADTARMPQNQAGSPAMSQNEAISLASYALQTPAYTHANPARAARAVAAEDWLAGQSRLTPDFGQYGPVNEYDWGHLRREVRASIGVSPQTPSQALVDRLLAAEAALNAGDMAAARAQLQPPVFPLGPDGTLAALSNLPTFPYLRQAFFSLNQNENRSSGPCSNMLNC